MGGPGAAARGGRRKGRCQDDPSHQNHRGRCSTVLAEETAFLAETNGVRRVNSQTGWPVSHRRYAAGRLGMSIATLDRALYRHFTRHNVSSVLAPAERGIWQ